MVQPYIVDIVPGATLFLELRVKDSDGVPIDVSTTTKSITVETGISAGDFTVSDGDDTGYIEVRADHTNTTSWPKGLRKARVWLDWGASADVEKEILIDLTLNVGEAL